MRILMIFSSILAFKTLPKNRGPSTFFRHFPQDTSKMPPRHPKTPPRHLQDASKTLQEASKTPLRPPKTSPRRLQAASSCLETPPKCYKIGGFEKSMMFQCFSCDFSSFFIFSGFLWRGKRQTSLSKQFSC